VSSRIDGMVSGPIHGPEVDVTEGAARSWLAIPVADTILIGGHLLLRKFTAFQNL